MEIDKILVGERIKSIRLSKGKNMREFGELISERLDNNKQDSPSDSIVSRWEKGVSIPNNERLKAIAELGGITVNELLYGTLEEYALNEINRIAHENNIELSQETKDNLFTNVMNSVNHTAHNLNQSIDNYNNITKHLGALIDFIDSDESYVIDQMLKYNSASVKLLDNLIEGDKALIDEIRTSYSKINELIPKLDK